MPQQVIEDSGDTYVLHSIQMLCCVTRNSWSCTRPAARALVVSARLRFHSLTYSMVCLSICRFSSIRMSEPLRICRWNFLLRGQDFLTEM